MTTTKRRKKKISKSKPNRREGKREENVIIVCWCARVRLNWMSMIINNFFFFLLLFASFRFNSLSLHRSRLMITNTRFNAYIDIDITSTHFLSIEVSHFVAFFFALALILYICWYLISYYQTAIDEENIKFNSPWDFFFFRFSSGFVVALHSVFHFAFSFNFLLFTPTLAIAIWLSSAILCWFIHIYCVYVPTISYIHICIFTFKR